MNTGGIQTHDGNTVIDLSRVTNKHMPFNTPLKKDKSVRGAEVDWAVAVNGIIEFDGEYMKDGLSMASSFTDHVEAALLYGGDVYARLLTAGPSFQLIYPCRGTYIPIPAKTNPYGTGLLSRNLSIVR